eukprot:m.423328 g.423328  ORF g.423328 m.423328 type:complete len:411 (-) comp40859_c0_seq1:163-1395(-)
MEAMQGGRRLPRWVWVAVGAVAITKLPELLHPRVELTATLSGRFAVVTGGSRGLGLGITHGLTAAGATVFITGRSNASVTAACADAPEPGKCIPSTVDSANDTALERFFLDVHMATGGHLDILVNNAFSGIGYWNEHASLGKPFWDTGMGLYDAVHTVGVRSHFKATILAMPLLKRALNRGLIVNTNSPGCLLYTFNVPYGMGKCAVDKMTADMAIEAATARVDVVSWWAQEPLQSKQVLDGGLEGATVRRGLPPVLGDVYTHLGIRFETLAKTALAGTLRWEGDTLSAFARDSGAARASFSGLALRTSSVAARYGVYDDRGIQPPPFLSIKWSVIAMVPVLTEWAVIPPTSELASTPSFTPTTMQHFVFNVLPDLVIPIWVIKLLAGTPHSLQWPGLTVRGDSKSEPSR